MNDEDRSGADRDFECRACELFEASVAGLDAPSRSRLKRSRQQALDIATGERRVPGVWKTGFAAGAVAASVLVAALLWRGPDLAPGLDAPVAVVDAPSPTLELLAANDEELQLAAADEELEFYAWVEAVAAATGGAGES